MNSRRDFLKHASLFALGGMLAGKAGNAVAAQPATAAVTKVDAAKRIGLQIYSLGPELDKDVPGGMKRLKQMGYQTLELAGYNNGKVRGIDMMEFKKMADDAGLEILSSHVNPPTIMRRWVPNIWFSRDSPVRAAWKRPSMFAKSLTKRERL